MSQLIYSDPSGLEVAAGAGAAQTITSPMRERRVYLPNALPCATFSRTPLESSLEWITRRKVGTELKYRAQGGTRSGIGRHQSGLPRGLLVTSRNSTDDFDAISMRHTTTTTTTTRLSSLATRQSQSGLAMLINLTATGVQ